MGNCLAPIAKNPRVSRISRKLTWRRKTKAPKPTPNGQDVTDKQRPEVRELLSEGLLRGDKNVPPAVRLAAEVVDSPTTKAVASPVEDEPEAHDPPADEDSPPAVRHEPEVTAAPGTQDSERPVSDKLEAVVCAPQPPSPQPSLGSSGEPEARRGSQGAESTASSGQHGDPASPGTPPPLSSRSHPEIHLETEVPSEGGAGGLSDGDGAELQGFRQNLKHLLEGVLEEQGSKRAEAWRQGPAPPMAPAAPDHSGLSTIRGRGMPLERQPQPQRPQLDEESEDTGSEASDKAPIGKGSRNLESTFSDLSLLEELRLAAKDGEYERTLIQQVEPEVLSLSGSRSLPHHVTGCPPPRLESRQQPGFWDSRGENFLPHSSTPEEEMRRAGDRFFVPYINCDELIKVKDLGRGVSATVSLYQWHGADVAVKEMKCMADEDSAKAVTKEAEIMARLRHPCVLSIYGMGTLNASCAMVFEYMVGGSLRDQLIMQRRAGPFPRHVRAEIALQVAQGMSFLHSRQVIHFDLKAANLLCDFRHPGRPVVKIGDMGLSKQNLATFVSGNMRGTLPWMAPELFMFPSLQEGSHVGTLLDRVNEKVDVYAMGITMWEIWTMGQRVYPDVGEVELLARGRAGASLRPEIPEDCDGKWAQLMQQCWAKEPRDRPSFPEIAVDLAAVRDRLAPAVPLA